MAYLEQKLDKTIMPSLGEEGDKYSYLLPGGACINVLKCKSHGSPEKPNQCVYKQFMMGIGSCDYGD